MPLFHITSRAEWEQAREAGEYRPDSLTREGFIHLSHERQWRGAAERFFRGRKGLVLLVIDPERLRHEVREEPADGDVFPHLYGPLNVDAVTEARELVLSIPLSLRTLAARWFAERSMLVAADGDARAALALREALTTLGAETVSEEWGLAGSVELTWTTLLVGGRKLIVEQESYEGITLRGPADLVERIAAMVRSR